MEIAIKTLLTSLFFFVVISLVIDAAPKNPPYWALVTLSLGWIASVAGVIISLLTTIWLF